MDNQPIELAQQIFKRFVATLYKLVVEDKNKYDLIIVGGNTGLSMARFTQIFYEKINIEPPIIIKVTPQRYKPGIKHEDENSENLFDNSILINDVKNQIRDYKIRAYENILFVDDEIYLGTTAKTCIDILSRIETQRKLRYTILAEDSGFTGFPVPENVNMKFIPFSKEIDGFYNIIMSIIPLNMNKILEEVFPEEQIPWHKRINILLGLPTRDKSVLLSGFNYSLNYLANEKIDKFEEMQNEFVMYLNSLIDAGIEEYKNGITKLDDYSYREKYLYYSN